MRHLVTGGSGFLGNLIARRLLAQGETVRILDIWKDPSLPDDIEFLHCDIRNRDGVLRAMAGIDVVHHNVALVPLTKSGNLFSDVNVVGSQIAAESAVEARVGAFVHMSSSAVFGTPRCPITDATPRNPVEVYGRAKLAGERAVQAICEKHDLPLIIIRPRTILGSGRLGIFQILFDWIRSGHNVYVIGKGDQPFQFVHAHDLMDAYMLALARQAPGAYNVGTNRFGTLRESLTNVVKHAGTASKVRSLPVGVTILALSVLDRLGLSPLAPWHYLTYHKPFYFDTAPLEAMGWNPKYSNDEMFAETYDWFVANDQKSTAAKTASAHRRPVREGILWLLKRLP